MSEHDEGRDGGGHLAQPAPDPPALPEPEDRPYPGTLQLSVDARDVQRCIFQVRQTIPVERPGQLWLLYPKWLPGFHAPAAQIELMAGLELYAGKTRLAWQRHPVEIYAFEVDVPEGCGEIEARFQFLSPTAPSQGDVTVTAEMLRVRWSAMVLYPAGFYSRGITVRAHLTLPPDWALASALEAERAEGATTVFRPVALDILADSPAFAGRWLKRVDLDEAGAVRLALAADREDQLAFDDHQLAPHRRLVAEADALCGSRHFDHYDFLVALSEDLGGGGVEHQRSCEILAPTGYFSDWDAQAPSRDVFAHEYVHAWNGKFRRGADSWTPSFERPIRNSLMWVYEGQTQYWGQVLAARSGLWSAQQMRDTLARTAAVYANRPGGRWRAMSDTTRDPIIAARAPLPWPSWQRSEDYYSEGQLLWLDVDTLIRELTGDERSLDDFARAFFGVEDGRMATCTYTFEDVTAALGAIVGHDWAGHLGFWLERREMGAPLAGLERGGYRLVYRKQPSDFAAATDASAGVHNLRFSVGLVVGDDGAVQEVIWDSPAFEAGLVAGASLLAVNGEAFSPAALKRAIDEAEGAGGLELWVKRGRQRQTLTIAYDGGHRYPHLERAEGTRARLDEILAARA